MHISTNQSVGIIIALLAIANLAMSPFALAQSSDADLRASIRAEILKDPRTASMSEAEITAMIDALTIGVQAEGIESNAFIAQSRSFAPTAAEGVPSCGGMPEFLCRINQALGFDGTNALIPIVLLATSGLLAFLLYELKHHARIHGHIPLQ